MRFCKVCQRPIPGKMEKCNKCASIPEAKKVEDKPAKKPKDE